MASRKKGKKKINIARFMLLAAAALLLLFIFSPNEMGPKEMGPPGSDHIHADFKVYIDGRPLNFSDSRFNERSPYAHLHTENFGGGDVIHIEGKIVPLSVFFESIGINITKDCITVENSSFCSTGSKKLRMFVNGKEAAQSGDYVPEDLDRILITYGPPSKKETERQINSVTDYACMHSGKCPEREIIDEIIYGNAVKF